jgi:hypothetical protein
MTAVCQRVGALVGSVAVTVHRSWITRRLLGPIFTGWPVRGLLVARGARSLPTGMGNRWNSSAAQPAIVQALGVDQTTESQFA